MKDAITITQKLGLMFVWVDAFCAIQDHPEDVAHEVNNMAHIYREAITVSTTYSHSVNDEFISRQHVNPVSSFKLSLRHEDQENGNISIQHQKPFPTPKTQSTSACKLLPPRKSLHPSFKSSTTTMPRAPFRPHPLPPHPTYTPHGICSTPTQPSPPTASPS